MEEQIQKYFKMPTSPFLSTKSMKQNTDLSKIEIITDF